jgi:hypothetical protein
LLVIGFGGSDFVSAWFDGCPVLIFTLMRGGVMNLSLLIQRTPRRVVKSFVFAYLCTVLMTAMPLLKSAQMFWQ